VVREEEGRRSYSLSPASADRDAAHLWDRRLFERRGCGLPVVLLGPRRAFTEPCRPLTFPSSLSGTPESESLFRPMRCPSSHSLQRWCGRKPQSQRTSASPNRWGSDGHQPENAFHRIENLRAETRKPCTWKLLKGPKHTRTVSPSAHPCPASGGAKDFFLASALSNHQQALRPPGGEDARCVQPMSATQTNYVHPHLVRSRFALATFAAGTPHGDLGSVR